MDLVAELLRVIEANRERLQASRIAQGRAGRVEIQVNPTVKRFDLDIVVKEKEEAA